MRLAGSQTSMSDIMEDVHRNFELDSSFDLQTRLPVRRPATETRWIEMEPADPRQRIIGGVIVPLAGNQTSMSDILEDVRKNFELDSFSDHEPEKRQKMSEDHKESNSRSESD